MPESLDLFAEVAAIRDMLDDHGAMLGAILRHMPGVREEILLRLEEDPIAAEVLLLVNGEQSQSEIVSILSGRGARGASKATVSRKMQDLQHLGLVEPTRQAKGQVWRLTKVNEALRITHELRRRRSQ